MNVTDIRGESSVGSSEGHYPISHTMYECPQHIACLQAFDCRARWFIGSHEGNIAFLAF